VDNIVTLVDRDDSFASLRAEIRRRVYLFECQAGFRCPPAAYPDAPAEAIFGSPHRMYEVIRRHDGHYDQFEPLSLTKARLRWPWRTDLGAANRAKTSLGVRDVLYRVADLAMYEHLLEEDN
jgi:hypothetical protein